MWLRTVYFLLCLFYTTSIGQYRSIFTKTVNLTTSNPEQEGANIILLKDTIVHDANDEWYMNVTDYAGFHMGIYLNESWGFHSNKTSNITVIIYSDDLTDGIDSDLLISFSVQHNEWFTLHLHIDSRESDNEIYPNCSQTTPISLASGDIKKTVASNNGWDRSTKAKAYHYNPGIFILPPNDSNGKTDQYPLIITLQNDPINDELIISYTNPTWLIDAFIQKCKYSSFSTGKGLQIYIAGEDYTDEIHSFYQFTVKYSYYFNYFINNVNDNISTSNIADIADIGDISTSNIADIADIADTGDISKWIIVAVSASVAVFIVMIICIVYCYICNCNKQDKDNASIQPDESIHTNEDVDIKQQIEMIAKECNTFKQNTDSNDSDGESLYGSNNNITTGIVVEGETFEQYENETEYDWIENALKICDNKEWERYLYNFKKHKITENRLIHIDNKDDHIWEQLIPEIGVRLQFIALRGVKQNNDSTTNNSFNDIHNV